MPRTSPFVSAVKAILEEMAEAPAGKKKVKKIYWDPGTKEIVVDVED
jgi:hypothetical protein